MDKLDNNERLNLAMNAAKANNIKPPFFKNLEKDFGINDIVNQEHVLSKLLERNDTSEFGIKIKKKGKDNFAIPGGRDGYIIIDGLDNNIIYTEDMNGEWELLEYDRFSQNQRFYQNSKGEIIDDRDIYPERFSNDPPIKSNRDIYPPYPADGNSSLNPDDDNSSLNPDDDNSSLNESTEVKKIIDLINRINII